MGVVSLELEVQGLKKKVEELKKKSVTDVFVQTLDGFNTRLTRVEGELRGLKVALGIIEKKEGEAGI